MRRDDRNADVQLDLVIRVYFVLIGISMVGFVGLPIAHLAGWLPDGVGLVGFVGFDIALATLIASQVVGLVGIAPSCVRAIAQSLNQCSDSAGGHDHNAVLDVGDSGDAAHDLFDVANRAHRRTGQGDFALLNADVDRRGERVA